jgi:hypothetical protein
VTNRRHPLPWSIHDGAFTLGGKSTFADHGEDYSLHLGRRGSGMEAPLSRDNLQALRDQIDAVLAAPFRVLIPNPGEHDEPWLADAIRDRLDALYAAHPHFEIAMLDVDAVDSAPDAWGEGKIGLRYLYYQTAADMFADGGDQVLLVAGPGALELARQAHEQRLAVQLVRGPLEVRS